MSDPLSAHPDPSTPESPEPSPGLLSAGEGRRRLTPVAPESPPSDGGPGDGLTGTEAAQARRRRRGSRGGRNRSHQVRDAAGGAERGAGVLSGSAPAGLPRPVADPDEPGGSVHAVDDEVGPDATIDAESGNDAAGRATSADPAPAAAASGPRAQPLPPRPKIGDSRPAPSTLPLPPARGPAPRRSRHAGAAQEVVGEAVSGSKRRHRTRTKVGEGAGPVDEDGVAEGLARSDRPVESAAAYRSTAVDDEGNDRRRGRERKGRPVGRYLMVVNVKPTATQIAVLEGRNLIEHYVSRPSDDANQIDGNIYLGRVQNVLPGMEAAFVDIGTPKNAVLYRGDVRYDKDDVEGGGDGGKPTRGRLPGAARDARIEQLLRPGQTVLCQVTKNPIGAKGARLAQEVSIPGRFVVLIPGSDTYGISKRLPDDERKRLRRILDDIRPDGHGLIVRTAAEGATADELRRDVARLTRQWERIEELAASARTPRLLYREPGMAVRVIREEFNRDYRGVIIDDRELFEEVRDYVASISPELADRVEFAGDSDDPLPAFERYHVHEQVHKALDRKVWLPSGGSLIIERTEALTVIDVNTGKNVGKSNLEETVFRNNLEAAEEIARQLRLRDIGGIIVIDFIDMEIVANRGHVIRTFRDALARDKTRTQVFDISELGLVEMTRKRISEGLVEAFSLTCPTCAGRGFILDESLF